MTTTNNYDIAALKAKYMPDSVNTSTGNSKSVASDGKTYDVEALRQQYLGSSALPQQKNITEDQKAAEESKATYKPTFGVNADDSTLTRAAKVVGNIPGSAFNFAKGVLGIVNPVNIFNNYKDIVSAIPDIASTYKYRKQLGESPVLDLGGDVAKSAYTNLVPEAARQVVSAIGNAAEGKNIEAETNIMDMSNAITNDPVGQILPFLLAAQGGAKAIDKKVNVKAEATMKNYVDNIGENVKNNVPIPEVKTSNLSGAFNKAVETTASPITKPTSYVFGKAKDVVQNTADYSARQLTGLDKSTFETAKANPTVDFSKINRQDLGREVQSRINKLSDELESTGKEYKPIRESSDIINVGKTDLVDMIKEATGLKYKDGKFQTSSNASLRDARDVRGIQSFFDTHKSTFERGNVTANEFLNIRQDLGKLSKFERDIGRSSDLENISKQLYNKLNTKYRSNIKGLEELDTKFGPLKEELRNASKGLVDSEGNLTDAGLTKIARVTENRPNLAAQLEKISPGFMDRVKLLQAAEDLRAASEKHKVGTYGRAIGQGGIIAGLATMNPVLIGISIAEMLVTNPSNAIKLIQKYGKYKEVINATIDAAKANPKLKEFVNNINTKPMVGSKEKPAAFAPKSPKIAEVISNEKEIVNNENSNIKLSKRISESIKEDILKEDFTNIKGVDPKKIKKIQLFGSSVEGKIKPGDVDVFVTVADDAMNWKTKNGLTLPHTFERGKFSYVVMPESEAGGLLDAMLYTGRKDMDRGYSGTAVTLPKNVWKSNIKNGAFSPKQTVK